MVLYRTANWSVSSLYGNLNLLGTSARHLLQSQRSVCVGPNDGKDMGGIWQTFAERERCYIIQIRV